MTSDRDYRQAVPPRDALAELERCAGTQFDPAVVKALAEELGTSREPQRRPGVVESPVR
jgi:HD-GYP domain-containing protein (c-di-GMP phosphodiesterase class II)